MTDDETERKIGEVIAILPRDKHEALTILMHVVAAYLSQAKMSVNEVTVYLVKITKMLDGEFDR